MKLLLFVALIGVASAQNANVFVLKPSETATVKAAYGDVVDAQNALTEAQKRFNQVKSKIAASHGIKDSDGDFNPDFTAFQGRIISGWTWGNGTYAICDGSTSPACCSSTIITQ